MHQIPSSQDVTSMPLGSAPPTNNTDLLTLMLCAAEVAEDPVIKQQFLANAATLFTKKD